MGQKIPDRFQFSTATIDLSAWANKAITACAARFTSRAKILVQRMSAATMLVAALGLALTTPAHAATTITVDTTSDASAAGTCTLRDAINTVQGVAVAGSSCNFAVDTSYLIVFKSGVTGTITLGSTLPEIAGNLTITGPTSSPGITIDGGSSLQLMRVDTSANLTLQFLTFSNGNIIASTVSGTADGGAISNQGTLVVRNGTFSTNQATGGNGGSGGDGDGGAIYNGGALTVIGSTFSANQAIGGNGGSDLKGDGGAIFNAGTLAVTNSTFSSNQATGGVGGSGNKGDGGAIYNSGALVIANTTFSGNQANGGSGGSGINAEGSSVFNDGGTVDLKGTILAASIPNNCSGGVTDAGYNISNDTSCNFARVTSSNNTDPLLSTLQANGGPTQTIALQTGSPAIDLIPVAECPSTDQRGFIRPDSGEDTCDAGAYESGAIAPFAGVPGTANCKGKSVSALSQQYGTLEAAAAALRYPDVKSLQDAIRSFCGG